MNIAKKPILIDDTWLSGILLTEPKMLYFDLSMHRTRIMGWASIHDMYASPNKKLRRLPSYIVIEKFKRI